MVERISRRTAFLCAGASLAVAGCATVTPLAGPVSVSAVKVDVGPLRNTGATVAAEQVSEALPGQLRQALGPRWSAKGGATLHAQIALIFLDSVSAQEVYRWGMFASQSIDSIEGDVWLTDPRGREIARTHILATRPVGLLVDPTNWDYNNHLRIQWLVESFAYWTPRQLGL